MPNSPSAQHVLILAPIRGITDVVYRDAFARCFGGFDRAIAPFIKLRQGQALRPTELRQVAPEQNRALRTIPQVLTNHAQTFSAALAELHDAGHDEVGWNLGCPTPMVVGRGRGAGLLSDPGRIDAILAEVLEKAPLRLSVKLRLGVLDPDEHVAVMEVLNRYPLTEVTLHARTADQMYHGTSDVTRAEGALALCRHPFVYNGDITALRGFRNLLARLPGAAGWMIGRGALACPFLPALLREEPDERRSESPALPPSEIRRERLREFHDLLYDGYGRWLSGPGHLLDRMREQWTYLALSFASPQRVNSHIRRCGDLATYAAAVDWVFERALAEPRP
ncbi:MAG: tRNA-dihydrouridine synthase family protein [Pseudomonadota bacterium]